MVGRSVQTLENGPGPGLPGAVPDPAPAEVVLDEAGGGGHDDARDVGQGVEEGRHVPGGRRGDVVEVGDGAAARARRA